MSSNISQLQTSFHLQRQIMPSYQTAFLIHQVNFNGQLGNLVMYTNVDNSAIEGELVGVFQVNAEDTSSKNSAVLRVAKRNKTMKKVYNGRSGQRARQVAVWGTKYASNDARTVTRKYKLENATLNVKMRGVRGVNGVLVQQRVECLDDFEGEFAELIVA